MCTWDCCNGRLNYISKYVSKDHDAVDVGMGEYCQKNASSSWLATYRLLSKGTPALPEVAIRLAQLSEFERSYQQVLLYPPQPAAMVDYEGRQKNFSSKMYGFYLQEMAKMHQAAPLTQSFLVWHRGKEYNNATGSILLRQGRNQQRYSDTMVVACRFWYELTDGYWGQFSLTHIPHLQPQQLLLSKWKHLHSMQNFVGMLEFLTSWVWVKPGIIQASMDLHFSVGFLPIRINNQGEMCDVGSEYVAGQLVFPTDRDAFDYMISLSMRDLQYRSLRAERVCCFYHKQEANFLLYSKVLKCDNEATYESLRQHPWAQR